LASKKSKFINYLPDLTNRKMEIVKRFIYYDIERNNYDFTNIELR